MVQTVIGIFRDNEQATAAVQCLMDINIGREMIDVAIPEPGESRGDITDEKGTLDSKLGRYFSHLFQDIDLARKYASVAQRGVTLAVRTENYAEALAAATILDQCGAQHVEEQSRVLEDSMTRQDRQVEGKEEKRERASAISEATSPGPVNDHTRDVPTPSLLAYRSRIIQQPTGDRYRLTEEEWKTDKAADEIDEGA